MQSILETIDSNIGEFSVIKAFDISDHSSGIMWHYRYYRSKIATNSRDIFEDVQCLGDSNSLSEISLDGNPICQEGNYKQTVLRHMQQLKQLDMKRVSEEERRLSLVMARKEEEKRREMNKIAMLKEKRRLAINNAKRQWETMQGSMMSRTSRMVKVSTTMPELFANHIGSVPSSENILSGGPEMDGLDLESLTSSDMRSRPTSARSNLTDHDGHSQSAGDDVRDRVSSGDIVNAEKLFGPLSHVATSQLPQYRLLSLMGDNRRKLAVVEGRKQGDGSGKANGMSDKTQVELIGRAGLTYSVADSKRELEVGRRQFARNYLSELTKEAVFSDRKRAEMMKVWPGLIMEMVQSALSDMSDMDGYMKRALDELDRG
ncbi:leucine-rich repeat-containing protein 49 [Elysia marginata]|uniref:Leucine-rich repeat-containing protein 49 n=1 Tax=Elysia marginata TaxID=1093978 RepID=A0AAV4IYQ6_9GAST|nr:leucine-rich repeat-containing protein 49 [Elysia marginata]